ncbi:hypothetical protein ASG78_02895 [Nostocoides sp. Soil756]|nr:hypothetical protein ASG78_02895 [Tetrasphaera sp. Soil756]
MAEEPPCSSATAAAGRPPVRVQLPGLALDPLSEADVVNHVVRQWSAGAGGLIVTPNVDIWLRMRREPDTALLVSSADIVVADGQPLVLAARLMGEPLPGRVTGASLVESLSAAAAVHDIPVYVIGGGEAEVALLAASSLADRHRGLQVVGHVTPPHGFERDPVLLDELVSHVVSCGPGIVLVGLGFPKQEWLAKVLMARLPQAWFLGCGAGVEMAAGRRRRAPGWAQRCGLEWLARLVQEPRRLARRYLVDDAPAAVALLVASAVRRWHR